MSFFTAEQVASLAASTARAAWLVEARFRSKTVRRWAGDTVLDAGGHEWKPTYGAVQIEGLGFSGEAQSRQVTLTLSGVDPELLPLAVAESDEADQQPLLIYLQVFGADWQPIGGLIPLFFGLMQPPRVDDTPASGDDGAVQTATLTVENAFFNRSRPANGRYTDRDQKRRSPGDRIMEFVSSLVFKTLRFPDF